nr:GntR family transcriptional regulator [Clostridia bacterium]
MINVDLRSRVPIYEQLIMGIRKSILSGELKPDEQLPSVRTLALELGINPNTIQKAYNELERQGAIYSLKGRGSFVSSDTTALGEEELVAIRDELERLLHRAKESGVTAKQMSEVLNTLCDKVWN